jgi:UDPglucose--hexose-1-phosphate uridylyltransferase
VLIAPNRGKRPYDMHNSDKKLIETALSPRLDRNRETYSLKNNHGDWLVKAVENKYPSLTPDNPKAYGKQEIVIDTPKSNVAFARLSEEEIFNALQVFKERYSELSKQNGIEYVLVFHNDGYNAGASLAHAHSQIFALPFVPLKFLNESRIIEEYVSTNNRDPFEDIITYERRHKVRMLCEDSRFFIFCPYASQWPFEYWILPKRKITNLGELDTTDLTHIARQLRQYCRKLTRRNISYNIYFENGLSANQRFCVKICGRSNVWGGFEVATGMVINTVPPESAAEWYRRNIKQC